MNDQNRRKRNASENESGVACKRPMYSYLQFEELKRENFRLKREIENYKAKYMRKSIFCVNIVDRSFHFHHNPKQIQH